MSNKVKKLKEHISSNFGNWSDLELALGEYTENINTSQEFDEIFEDIGNHLAEYLIKEEKKLDFNHKNIDKKKLFEYLVYPEKTLTLTERNNLEAYKNKWNTNVSWHVNVITFNYTKSFEKLVGDYGNSLILGANKYLNNIHHIHGYVDDRMVMGVNDVSQIGNKKFHNDLNIREALVKKECNLVCGHTIDSQCEKLINSSNLICIFGSSLGNTDKLWWDLISKKLIQNNCKLIIFEWVSENISSFREYKKERVRREKKESFLNKTTLTDEEKEIAKENIFIGVNTELFSDIYPTK